MAIEFDAPLLRWGNSYAIRITRQQAEELGARPGVPLHARIEPAGLPQWNIPTFAGGPEGWALSHDAVLGETMDEERRTWPES